MLEPEFLATLEADIHLVADLISLRSAIPEKTRETARQVVRRVVDALMARLEHKTTKLLRGALNRSRNARAGLAPATMYRLGPHHWGQRFVTTRPNTSLSFQKP